MNEELTQETTEEQTGRFTTFSGVFRPNTLTILGMTFYLLVGWVVGQAGVWNALAIMAMANCVTFLTGLSISTIATGMKIKAGGNYYMISRSLGQEIGGTIGIQLYISQAISVAFYIIGFSEVFTNIEMFAHIDPRIVGTVAISVFAVIVFFCADIAMKLHLGMFIILLGTLTSFFLGGWGDFNTEALTPHYDEGQNFWTVFAVFFPAVTGIAIGASMSGDLKKPEENIPRGTMYSIFFTAAMYLLAAVWYGLHASPEQLKTEHTTIILDIALFPQMVLIGMLSATLSSTLSSMLAAPRILKAIADDGIIPSLFTRRLGSKHEPGMAIVTTFLIALCVIWAGDLKQIAPVIAMFFLNTYGMTNFVALVETLVQNPNFRPKFKVHPILYFLGFASCYVTMFLINPMATGIAITASILVYVWLTRRHMEQTWGDVRSGIWKSIAKLALLKVEEIDLTKNWRLNIVAFSKQKEQRHALMDFAKRLKYGHGITTFVELISYQSDEGKDFLSIRANKLKRIQKEIKEKDIAAFSEVVLVPDLDDGVVTVSQANGTGSMEPNTVLLGLSHTKDGRARQFDIARQINDLNKTVLIYKKNEAAENIPHPDNVDIWWKGDKGNFSIMLMLAYLMTRHKTRTPGRIRVIRMVKDAKEKAIATKYLRYILNKTNIDAEITTIEATEDTFCDSIPEVSGENGIAMIGFSELPELENGEQYMEKINRLSTKTNGLLLVSGANLKKSSSNIVPMENLLNI